MSNKFVTWLFKHVGEWLQKEEPRRRSHLADFDRITYELRPGDVILIEGRHRISRIIRQITQSSWSHAALYIGRLHDIEDEKIREKVRQACQCPPTRQLILESLLGFGTIVAPLEKYRYEHLRICRPIGLSRTDAQRVIAYGVNRLGMKYSVRHILDLFRFLFPWGLWPRRWRSILFQHNALQPTEDICSSLIAQAFESVNFPILPIIKREKNKIELIHRNPRLFTPSDFDYSPYFAIIKYPIFPIGEPAAYQKLPWVKGFMSDDQGTLMPSMPLSIEPLKVENKTEINKREKK